MAVAVACCNIVVLEHELDNYHSRNCHQLRVSTLVLSKRMMRSIIMAQFTKHLYLFAVICEAKMLFIVRAHQPLFIFDLEFVDKSVTNSAIL